MAAVGAMLLLCAGFVNAGDAAKPDGAKLFAAKCASCHAKDGKGNAAMVKMFKLKDPAVINLTLDATTKKTDADLAKVILAGRSKMPSFKDKLKDEEISAIIGYARSLAPAPKTPAVEAKKGT